jgi:ribonuclease J
MIKDSSLKIISLGGFGNVTKNMFVYETSKDILIVDCGVGFPEEEMMGVDLVIPDISYLAEKGSKIKGLVLTHGHDDHIGGLPYILPQLPKKLPVFGPKWALALADKDGRVWFDG